MTVCAVVMIVNVIATGANNIDEFTVIGKVAAIIFIVDLFFYVAFTIVIALFKKK